MDKLNTHNLREALEPSRLVFGTNSLSTIPSRRSVFSLLSAVANAGILRWDTARAYGRGYGERLVGEFLQAHGLRVALTVKVGMGEAQTSRIPTRIALRANGLRRQRSMPVPSAPGVVKCPSPLQLADIQRSLDETFRCLKVNAVDTLLLHENLPSLLNESARAFLRNLVQDATVRQLGAGTNAFVLDAYYEPVDGFTVLQYEGAGKPGLPDLIARFPDATHYRHGFLHGLSGNAPAMVLAAAQRDDPSGCIVFSTRSVARLHENIGMDPLSTR